MYTPNSSVRLLSTDLVMGDEHTYRFDNKEEQAEFFKRQGSSYWGADNLTFIKDGVIKINGNINKFYKYNYMMYKNTEHTDKWFYAFITNVEYVSELVTLVFYKIDVLQTWYFDFVVNKSYVDRQHLSNDTYSNVADSVATGTLVLWEAKKFWFTGCYFVFITNDVTVDDTSSSPTQSFTCGRYTIPCQVVYFPASTGGATDLNNFLQAVSNKGRADRIQSCVYIPFLDNSNMTMTTKEVTSTDIGSFTIVESVVIDMNKLVLEFTPYELLKTKYAKMRTKPYSEIRLTDSTTGQYIQLDYGKFNIGSTENTIKFQIQCTISPSPTYRIIPLNYCNQTYAYDQSLVVNCNTVLPTINNTYANYMMRNSNINNLNKEFAKGEKNLALQGSKLSRNQAFVNSGVGAVGSLINRNPMGAVQNLINGVQAQQNYNQKSQEIEYSSYEKIAMISAQEDSASTMASQMTDISDGAMERLIFDNGVTISVFGLDSYNKQNVENFWNMYGYSCHTLMKVNHRIPNQNWCYCKLISPNIVGFGIPQNELKEINDLYEKGITWWEKEHFKQYE